MFKTPHPRPAWHRPCALLARLLDYPGPAA